MVLRGPKLHVYERCAIANLFLMLRKLIHNPLTSQGSQMPVPGYWRLVLLHSAVCFRAASIQASFLQSQLDLPSAAQPIPVGVLV